MLVRSSWRSLACVLTTFLTATVTADATSDEVLLLRRDLERQVEELRRDFRRLEARCVGASTGPATEGHQARRLTPSVAGARLVIATPHGSAAAEIEGTGAQEITTTHLVVAGNLTVEGGLLSPSLEARLSLLDARMDRLTPPPPAPPPSLPPPSQPPPPMPPLAPPPFTCPSGLARTISNPFGSASTVQTQGYAFGTQSVSGYCSNTGGGLAPAAGSRRIGVSGIHCWDNLNDGLFGNSYSWIAGTPPPPSPPAHVAAALVASHAFTRSIHCRA